jgi:hypothetical protein
MSAASTLSRFYVYFIIAWLCIWIPLRYYAPLQLRIRHTYQLPAAACTNTLVSDYDTFEGVREGLMVFYILVPFAACLMIWSRESIGWTTHLLTALTGMVWALIMVSYDINDLSHANVPPNDPNFRIQNLARDNKWCLYWGGQPGTDLLCSNSAPCVGSPVDPTSFTPNRPFLFRFLFNIFILLMITFDVWLLWLWRQSVLKRAVPQTTTSETTSRRYAIKNKQ